MSRPRQSAGRKTVVVAGYLVRFPIGGYFWQAAHYLQAFRALGYDVWFYEDTSFYAPAYNPLTGASDAMYDYGLTITARFLEQLGLGQRWGFIDLARQIAYGPGASLLPRLLQEADLLVNLGGMNRLEPERRGARATICIDFDPVYTHLRLAQGSPETRRLLEAYTHLFTFGENIGTSRSPTPTGDYRWYPTRQPIVLDWWQSERTPGLAYTTIGRWNASDRDMTYQGETLQWRKRTEWLRCLDLPGRTGATFEVAMDVESVPDDMTLLARHGWHVVNPLRMSTDPWLYKAYIEGSRGEFTVAKEMNVRLYSGWFSDRTACYLAAGRPVVVQDTGFGACLPLGPGLHAFRSVEEASEAIACIEGDYARASAHASAVAREYFAAERVLGDLLQVVGL